MLPQRVSVGGVVAGGRRTSRDREVSKRIRKRWPPGAAESSLALVTSSEPKLIVGTRSNNRRRRARTSREDAFSMRASIRTPDAIPPARGWGRPEGLHYEDYDVRDGINSAPVRLKPDTTETGNAPPVHSRNWRASAESWPAAVGPRVTAKWVNASGSAGRPAPQNRHRRL